MAAYLDGELLTISLASLEKLRAARLSTEQMDAVLEVLTVELAPLEHGRLANAERQKRYKERRYTNVVHGNVTETFQTSRVEDKPLLPSLTETASKNPPLPPAPSSQPLPIDPEGFEEFWAIYPKRNGSADRKPAIKAFIPAVKRAGSLETLLHGAKRYAAECRDKGKIGTEFVKQARTWLNADGWAEYEVHVSSSGIATPMTVAVIEGSEAWQAWKATGRKMPITDLRIDGRVKRGWYFPSEFPPNGAMP